MNAAPRFTPRRSWDRRVGQGQNLGRRRTDHLERRRMAQAVAHLGLAVRIGMTLALVGAIGATFVAWRAHLLPGPLAILVALCFAAPWAVAHHFVSRSRRSDPFPHVDRRITLP